MLTPMTKQGEFLAVDPSCVADHQRIGWKVATEYPDGLLDAPEPDPAPAADPFDGMTVAELRAWLDGKAEIPDGAKKADLQALARATAEALAAADAVAG